MGLAKAFDAAKHGAFTLVIDCPVRAHIGTDIARSIFIDDGTSVDFTAAGKLTIDNVMHPAFVIANSKDIALTNWNLEYAGGVPVDMKSGSYEKNGQVVSTGSNAPAAGAFNDLTLSQWLNGNRGIQFDKSQGNVNSMWMGPSNTSAVFFIAGDSSNIKVTGMHLYAPPGADANAFIPMAFSLTRNYKSNQRVTKTTPLTSQYVGIPHDLTFSDIDLDGYYMGWQGNMQNVTWDRIRAHRYADLQDANGQNVGGVGKWFAPPHLFYLNFDVKGDPQFINRNLRLHDIVDGGPRVGSARDKGGSDTGSGYAMSIKIGGIDNSVDGYVSKRPDGFLDILQSENLSISNVDATYDSSFINDLYPGWRFPQAPYKNVAIKNVVYRDLAKTSVQQPLDDANRNTNDHIVISNVRVELNHWAGKNPLPVPTFAGTSNDIDIEYFVKADGLHITSTQKGPVLAMLTAKTTNGATTLSWTSKQADNCRADGGWAPGALAPSGEQTVQGGDRDFALSCSGGGVSVATKMRRASAVSIQQ